MADAAEGKEERRRKERPFCLRCTRRIEGTTGGLLSSNGKGNRGRFVCCTLRIEGTTGGLLSTLSLANMSHFFLHTMDWVLFESWIDRITKIVVALGTAVLAICAVITLDRVFKKDKKDAKREEGARPETARADKADEDARLLRRALDAEAALRRRTPAAPALASSSAGVRRRGGGS